MMSDEQIKHMQETYVALGDEFLIQYLLGAPKEFRKKLILSRLFAMGQSIELYLKSALIIRERIPAKGHDIPKLIMKYDPSLSLSAEEKLAGESLFASNLNNIDLGLWLKHEEALELYQAEYFLKDLKYYIRNDQQIIYPMRKTLLPVNMRYLKLVKYIRRSIKYRNEILDKELKELVSILGLQINPALYMLDSQK